MEIYIDVYILENIIIDLFLLLLSFKLLRFNFNKRNIYIAAVVGGIYALVIFCNVKILSSIAMRILMVVFMMYISLENKNLKYVLKSTVVYFMLTFMLGGACFATVQMQNSYIIGKAFVVQSNSIKYLVLIIAIAFIFITRIADLIKERAVVKNFLYDIYITEGQKSVLTKGFLDTGNELREPVTNLPCIILESNYFNQFDVPEDKKFIIKYDTINEIGEVKGFKGDIMIRNEDSNSWTKISAIICRCERKLSKEDEFHALLSRGII